MPIVLAGGIVSFVYALSARCAKGFVSKKRRKELDGRVVHFLEKLDAQRLAVVRDFCIDVVLLVALLWANIFLGLSMVVSTALFMLYKVVRGLIFGTLVRRLCNGFDFFSAPRFAKNLFTYRSIKEPVLIEMGEFYDSHYGTGVKVIHRVASFLRYSDDKETVLNDSYDYFEKNVKSRLIAFTKLYALFFVLVVSLGVASRLAFS